MKQTVSASVMVGLWRVKRLKALRWPVKIIDPNNSRGAKFASNRRGGPGYVVDLDLSQEKIFCRAQEKFLEKCEDGDKEARALVITPEMFPKPVVNWMIKNGFLSSSARIARKAREQVKDREKAAVPPPKVLPGLSTAPEPEPAAPPVRTPRPQPQESSDAVEGQEGTPAT